MAPGGNKRKSSPVKKANTKHSEKDEQAQVSKRQRSITDDHDFDDNNEHDGTDIKLNDMSGRIDKMDGKLDSLFKAVGTFAEFQKQMTSFAEQITQNKNDIKELNHKLTESNERGADQKQAIEAVTSQTERIDREMRKWNLLIVGIAEEKDESQDQLREITNKLCSSITKVQIDVDTVYRFGKKFPGKPRMIKVKFRSIDDRNKVYGNRTEVKFPVYIN